MKIEFKNIIKSFAVKNNHDIINVLDDISFEVKNSEIFCLVGPSGCGKSTIINLMAGFIFPDKGEISMDNKLVNGPGPQRTVVFQEHAIFPWKTVRGNIEFGLKCKNLSKSKINDEVNCLLKKVKLESFADRYPDELSVGMKQRVAMARAFAVKSEVVFMDEPFASLDSQTRDILQEELLNIQIELKQTIIFVTHNIDEAIFLGDKIAVMSHRPAKIKEIIQVGYERPRSASIRNQPYFFELKNKIWLSLRDEI